MDFQQIRKYVKGVLTNSFLNKTTLDKLSTSDEGNLLFDGKEINSNSVEWNQIQTEGVKIAEVTIDGIATEIFAPNGGEGSGEISAPNGGVESGIVVDTLIDATITTTDSYELSASVDNYDMLIVTGMTYINNSDYEQLNSLTIMKDDYYIEAVNGWSHSLNFSISGSTRRAVFNFNNGKLNVVKIENAALKKIYGIKFLKSIGVFGGANIDYDNMLEQVTTRNYTASEDCYVEIETYANDNKEEHYFINGIFVGRESINGEVIYLKNFFLRKGDIISFRDGVAHTTTIRVFGLKTTESSYHNYSTEEKVVGKWIDGKPIYEKSYLIQNTISLNDNWVPIIQISENIKYLVYSMVYDPYYNNNMYLIRYREGYLEGFCPLMIGINSNSYITIQYTKTTDY